MHVPRRAATGAATLLATTAGVLAVAGPAALADPTQNRNVTVGTADCGSDGTFTFLTTSNNGRGTPWSPAFVLSTSGRRALFHPASLDLTFTSPQGVFTEDVTRGGGPGPVVCTVAAAPFPGATLSGTVTGTLTWRG